MLAKRRGMMSSTTKALWATALVSATFILGCSRAPGGESGQSLSQALTPAPVTVTLSAPTSLSPIGPVLLGENSVTIGALSDVVSGVTVSMGARLGNLQVQSGALVNNSWSLETALLFPDVQVRGTLYASNAIIGPFDVVQAQDTTPVFTPQSTLTWTVTNPVAPPYTNVLLNIGQAQTLAPGSYGVVTVNPRATLTLTTGTYYLTDFNLLLQSSVNLDQGAGPVIIYITNSVQLGGAFESSNNAPPNLFIGYLGILPVLVGPSAGADGGPLPGSPYTGALIAPNALLTLNPVLNGIHTGFFSAENIVLAPLAQVQYQVPAALVAAAGVTGPQCGQLLAGAVPPAQIPQFCSSCLFPLDSDRDGVPDCIDGCPNDPLKVQPGICGCGSSDVDSDGDGFPDCIDKCPNDPNNTYPGQCGCVGSPLGVTPAGSVCTDTACPQTGATCNGAGVCGNRAVCSPATGSQLFGNNGTSYWLTGPGFGESTSPLDGGPFDAGLGGGAAATESAAQAACTAKGLTLTRISSLMENRLITSLLSGPIWLGANDIATSGAWRWSAPGTSSGDEFWSGGPTGSPVNSLFSNWGPNAPGSQPCALMRSGDGFWFDTSCSETLGYICEFRTPLSAVLPLPPPGAPASPPPRTVACVPEEAGGPLFKESLQELMNDLDAAKNDVFVGAASNPPAPDATCPSDNDFSSAAIGLNPAEGAGCSYQVPAHETFCTLNSDCSAGQVCRAVQTNPNCAPPDAGPGTLSPTDADTCPGTAVCVVMTCPTDPQRVCQQIEICNPGTSFDASPDPGSNLSGQPFSAAALFDSAIPDAAGVYNDPPDGSGVNHTWCHMAPQNPNGVVPAQQNPANNTGSSSTPSISFDFEPKLTFNVNPNPLALGETNFGLQAQAALDAEVSLNHFLGQSYTASILHAEADLNATRCSVDDNGTALKVFGIDLIKVADLGIPEFNTANDFPEFTVKCQNTINNYVVAANRAKKAFRDAQQLLSQYYSAKSDGGVLTNLCEQAGIATSNVPFFPGGSQCYLNEPPEVTINRFIDFYQGSSGVLGFFAQADQELQSASSSISSVFSHPNLLPSSGSNPLSTTYNLQFANVKQNESQTIISATFPIGPIPLVLQVDVFAAYGVQGAFTVDLDFSALGIAAATKSTSAKLAEVSAQVMPYASAGLSAFVGVGFSLGPIGAAVGIEGDVTLAEVRVPIFAGAGLDVNVTKDNRQAPPDIMPPISLSALGSDLGAAVPFGVPKNIGFSVWYNYGIGLDLDNILSGEIDASLRINFFFFSRTWRERVVQFNGWSKHFDLVSGAGSAGVSVTPMSTPSQNGPPPSDASTTPVASGVMSMGVSQAQVPLTLLAHLVAPSTPALTGMATVDAVPVGTGTPTSVDTSKVQQFFYENLCCTKTGPCQVNGQAPSSPPCCAGLTCVPPTPGTFGEPSCQPLCRGVDEPCQSASDCCTASPQVVCGSLGLCEVCAPAFAVCKTSSDCCADTTGCVNGTCAAVPPPQ